MDQNIINQTLSLIDKSKRILLLTHAKADPDGLGAMLSLYLVLKNLGKDVTAVTNDPAPKHLDFLPSIDMVQNSVSSVKDFIITLDCTRTPLNKIKYNLEGGHVNIIITPKEGQFSKNDVSFLEGGAPYDLIMVFDTGNLEHLGMIYDQNTEMFFKTPIINVDHHASNTDYGQVNLVDVVAASTTEVVFSLLEAMEQKYQKKFISEDIATLLLAGLITDTGSFQHANTSPAAMETAAKLLDHGARQQEIIKNIYKTKKLSTLKLWGIVLSKVQVDPIYRLVWSTITKEDLTEAGADSEESGDIIDDLLSNAPGVEIIMLIKWNEQGYVSVSTRSTSNAVDVAKFCQSMGGGGHVRAAGFKIKDGRPFDMIQSDVIAKARDYQAKRLNIFPEDLKAMPAGQAAPQAEVPRIEKPKQAERPPQKPQGGTPPEAGGGRGGTPQPPAAPAKPVYLEFKAPAEPKVAPAPKPQQLIEHPMESKPMEAPKPQGNGTGGTPPSIGGGRGGTPTSAPTPAPAAPAVPAWLTETTPAPAPGIAPVAAEADNEFGFDDAEGEDEEEPQENGTGGTPPETGGGGGGTPTLGPTDAPKKKRRRRRRKPAAGGAPQDPATRPMPQ